MGLVWKKIKYRNPWNTWECDSESVLWECMMNSMEQKVSSPSIACPRKLNQINFLPMEYKSMHQIFHQGPSE